MSGAGSLRAFAGGPFATGPQPTRFFLDPSLLEQPLAGLDGVRAPLARRLSSFGLETVGDLLAHYPRRYEDFRERKDIAALKVGEEATIRATIERVTSERTRRRNVLLVKATLQDPSGVVQAVWFNQGYLAKVFEAGMVVSVRGTYKRSTGLPQFVVRAHEILGERDDVLHTEGIVAVYPASEGISARVLRALVAGLRPIARSLPEPLPARVRAAERLPTRADAVLAMHMPRSLAQAGVARARLVLEELLLLQLGLLLHKQANDDASVAAQLGPPGRLSAEFTGNLPFALTEFQSAALAEIEGDLESARPMRRLLQGDVGSGKTVVALYTLLRAVESGRQAVMLAPTETLAEQHLETFGRLAGELVEPLLLTARLSAAERRSALAALARGECSLAVGTHALLQGDVAFRDLAVVVVDEQHRFGVAQRDELARRAGAGGRTPHTLYMTATPIPRTLALTFYGDLDVTVLRGGPEGRTPVVTRLVDESDRSAGYDFVRRQLDAGRQAYVVCPLIDESDSLETTAALAEAERLRRGELHGYRIAVLHGQVKAQDRDAIMAAFKAGETDVLVATSVIEVGVDVPNASIMIVEGADRFGLAQLHQLRGRVGRGTAKSYCLLFSSAEGDRADARLRAMLETTDGFELADRDMELRGEGQLFGARQSGLPDLKLAKLSRDRDAVVHARDLARQILADDPHLLRPDNAVLRDAVSDTFGDQLGWLLKA